MTDHDPFDRDLRATLDGLAREPAPDVLIDRIASIPGRQPVPSGRGARLWDALRRSAPGFAAVAAVVVVALAAIALRPATAPAPVGGTPSLAIVTSPSPSAVAPTPAPTATVAPTTEPSTAPSATPSAKPTQRPVAGGPVPEVFQPLSVTFVSGSDGWVLGRGACGDQDCPVIARTSDGGRTWTTVPAPPAEVVVAPSTDEPAGTAVSGVRFANLSDGWAFRPGLWATHDGGSRWTPVRVPGLPDASQVVALETAAGKVHAVFYDGDHQYRIATSPIGRDDWTLAPLRIDVGAGPVPTAQLVLSGAGGWILVDNRVVLSGARLHDGGWQDWQPPCVSVTGPAVMDASSATELVAACDVGSWGDPGGEPVGEHTYVSHDGGVTFARSGTATPVDGASGIAATGAKAFVVAGGGAQGSVLVATSDAGRTWATVRQGSLEQASDLGFTTASQGVVILTDDQGQGRLLMTRDGGHTWDAVRFRS